MVTPNELQADHTDVLRLVFAAAALVTVFACFHTARSRRAFWTLTAGSVVGLMIVSTPLLAARENAATTHNIHTITARYGWTVHPRGAECLAKLTNTWAPAQQCQVLGESGSTPQSLVFSVQGTRLLLVVDGMDITLA